MDENKSGCLLMIMSVVVIVVIWGISGLVISRFLSLHFGLGYYSLVTSICYVVNGVLCYNIMPHIIGVFNPFTWISLVKHIGMSNKELQEKSIYNLKVYDMDAATMYAKAIQARKSIAIGLAYVLVIVALFVSI